jgi:hypothetical protein
LKKKITVLIVIVICFIIRYIFFNDIIRVKSDIDNNIYIIRRGPKSDEFLKASANTLAIINGRIIDLIKHLDNTLPDAHWVKILKKNYNNSILSEAAIDSRYTTFTINKSDMHICLRTRDSNDKLYDINLLMYVVLHELAHLCNYTKENEPIQGHGKEFKEIFRILVQQAIQSNNYKLINYSSNPQEYCGMRINSSIL